MDLLGQPNRTGLNLTHGMYIPPYDRKATVPVMLYRGHVVKLGKGDQDYYGRHVVQKYQMHSLNAGFSGKVCIPLKDQSKFKIPKERTFRPSTSRGKWSNYPMSVELGKYTRGFEGKYVENPARVPTREKPRSPMPRAWTSLSARKSIDIPSRPLPSPLDFNAEAKYYEDMEPEIIDIMAARNEVFQSYQNRVESALLNDSDYLKDVRSNPASRLGFPEPQKPTPTLVRPRTTSLIIEDAKSNLLLPVPFVMPVTRRQFKFQHKQNRSYSAPSVGL